MKEKGLEKLAEMIKDIKFTMMTTIDHEGRMHSRPMATMKINDIHHFDGNLWFFTKIDSTKVYEIDDDHEVNLAYANPDKQQYISVTGTGIILKDQSKMQELWIPTLKAWFPEGLEDPQLALIKVKVDFAELWDTPPSKVVQIFGMAKSLVTGKPYDPKKVNGHHLNIRPH